MPLTQITANMLSSTAALNNLNALGTVALTPPVTLGSTLAVTGNITAANVAYSTGDQTLLGTKTFSGNIVCNGTANRMPNQRLDTNDAVVTKLWHQRMSDVFFKCRKTDYGNSAAWRTFTSSASIGKGHNGGTIRAYSNAGTPPHSINILTNDAEDKRGRLGNDKTGGNWGSTDWAGSTFRLYVELTGTGGRIDHTTDSFAFAFGNHIAYGVTNSLLSSLVNPNVPASTDYLVGFSIELGAIKLWSKIGTSSTSSAVLTTLSNTTANQSLIGEFVLECSAGVASLYRNGVLLGTHTAPNVSGGTAGPSAIGINFTTTSASQREFFIQQAAITWY